MIYFYLFKSTSNRQWYFSVNSANHQVIAQSEGYHNKQDALHTINVIRAQAGTAKVLDGELKQYVA